MLTRVVRAVALLAFVAVAAGAQRSAATSKSAWIVSGLASFAQQSGDRFENASGDGVTTISFAPTALYFVIPGLGVGGSIGYSKSSQGDDSESLTTYGPTVAYYFDTGNSMIPYIGAGMEWGTASSESSGFSSDIDGSRMKVGGGVLLRKGHLGIAIEAGYIKETVNGTGGFPDVKGNILAIGVGLVGLLHR